jgi:hypothetical protein
MIPVTQLYAYAFGSGLCTDPAQFFKAWDHFMFSEGWNKPSPGYAQRRLDQAKLPTLKGKLQLVLHYHSKGVYVEGVKLISLTAISDEILIYDLATRNWELTTESAFLDVIKLSGRRDKVPVP